MSTLFIVLDDVYNRKGRVATEDFLGGAEGASVAVTHIVDVMPRACCVSRVDVCGAWALVGRGCPCSLLLSPTGSQALPFALTGSRASVSPALHPISLGASSGSRHSVGSVYRG